MYLAWVQVYWGEWECTWLGCKCNWENGDVSGLVPMIKRVYSGVLSLSEMTAGSSVAVPGAGR